MFINKGHKCIMRSIQYTVYTRYNICHQIQTHEANVFWLSRAKPQKIPSVKMFGFEKNIAGSYKKEIMTTCLKISVFATFQNLLL